MGIFPLPPFCHLYFSCSLMLLCSSQYHVHFTSKLFTQWALQTHTRAHGSSEFMKKWSLSTCRSSPTEYGHPVTLWYKMYSISFEFLLRIFNFCKETATFWRFIQFMNGGKWMPVFSTCQCLQRTLFLTDSMAFLIDINERRLLARTRTRPPNQEVVSKLHSDFRRNETTRKPVKRYTAQTENGRSGSK